jgi:hypothetical protein
MVASRQSDGARSLANGIILHTSIWRYWQKLTQA